MTQSSVEGKPMSESRKKEILTRDLPWWVSTVLGVLFVATWLYMHVTSGVSPEVEAQLEHLRASYQYYEEAYEARKLAKAGELNAAIEKLEDAVCTARDAGVLPYEPRRRGPTLGELLLAELYLIVGDNEKHESLRSYLQETYPRGMEDVVSPSSEWRLKLLPEQWDAHQ